MAILINWSMHNSNIDPILRLTLEQLKLLQILLKERSVSRCASHSGYSQPYVSQVLAKLRLCFGDQLLVRSRTGFELTRRAEALRPQIDYNLPRLIKSFSPDAFDPAEHQGVFHIATPDYGEKLIVPKLLQVMIAKAPQLDLRVRNLKDRFPLAELESGSVDLALTFLPIKSHPALFVTELMSDEFATVCRKQIQFHEENISLVDFCSLPHLVVSPFASGVGGFIDVELTKLGLMRRVIATTSGFSAALDIVGENDLFTTLPRRLVSHHSAHKKFRIFKPPVRTPAHRLGMVWHRVNQEDPAHTWMRQLLVGISFGGLQS